MPLAGIIYINDVEAYVKISASVYIHTVPLQATLI